LFEHKKPTQRGEVFVTRGISIHIYVECPQGTTVATLNWNI